MIIAEVIGNVVATQKDEKLNLDGSARGEPFMVIDRLGAGEGETVLVVMEGKSSMQILGRGLAPVDMAVVGIIDHYTVDGATTKC